MLFVSAAVRPITSFPFSLDYRGLSVCVCVWVCVDDFLGKKIGFLLVDQRSRLGHHVAEVNECSSVKATLSVARFAFDRMPGGNQTNQKRNGLQLRRGRIPREMAN